MSKLASSSACLSLLALFALFAGALTGCGGTASEDPAAADEADLGVATATHDLRQAIFDVDKTDMWFRARPEAATPR